VSAAKPSSEEAVAKVLASGNEMTATEAATATGLGRSTVTKALAALERAGVVRRHPGGRHGRRRIADRWSIGHSQEPSPSAPSAQRLRPGQLDGLVLDYIDAQGTDAAVGANAVAKALGRSAGAVGNCLTRLAAASRVRQVSNKPRRYSSAASAPGKRRRASRPRKEGS
jgi:DNA-binding transcriptional ArsR family regulator